MCTDTAWSIPCCAAVSASISVEGPLSAVGAPHCELENVTEGRAEESGEAYTCKGGVSQHWTIRQTNTTPYIIY